MSSIQYDPRTGLPKVGQPSQAWQNPVSDTPWRSSFAPSAPLAPVGAAPSVTPGPVSPGRVPGYGGYQQIIQSDPQYSAALADLRAQGVADDASAEAQAIRALSLFGEVPSLEGADANIVGPNFAGWSQKAAPLAQKATQEGLSIAARLQKQYKDNLRALKNQLAARGALRSGEAGYQLGEENQRYKEAQFDARTKLVDFLSGIEAGRAAAARARAGQASQAIGGAMDRALVMFPSQANREFPAPSGPIGNPNGVYPPTLRPETGPVAPAAPTLQNIAPIAPRPGERSYTNRIRFS